MLEISNKTPFETAIVPGLDKDGYDYAAVVIKATFDIQNNNDSLSISENQIPIVFSAEYYGDPENSSIKYESDTALSKKRTDVVLIGHAYSRRGKKEAVDVKLRVGALDKTVRAIGNRRWFKALGFWHTSDPVPFGKMPLLYENAFGGIDTAHSKPAKQGCEKRNPVGTGFCISGKKDHLNGLHLPNIEDPRRLIKKWKDRPPPAGLGFIAPNWEPRVHYAGTYDEIWQKERLPLLPKDFNELFFNSAHPDLISKQYLRGREPVNITNASKDNDLSFYLPEKHFDVSVLIKGEKKEFSPNLDTVIIEPDEQRVMLAWRATIPCFRQFSHINMVGIKEKS